MQKVQLLNGLHDGRTPPKCSWPAQCASARGVIFLVCGVLAQGKPPPMASSLNVGRSRYVCTYSQAIIFAYHQILRRSQPEAKFARSIR